MDMEGLTRAVQRVGKSPAELLSWLMDFETREIADGDDGDALQLRTAEVGAFISTAAPGLNIAGRLLFADEACAIQAQLRQALGDLRTTGRFSIDAPTRRFVCWEADADGRGHIELADAPGIRTTRMNFMEAVARVLLSVSGRLRMCDAPGCARFFAANRPHQLRCSSRCTTRVTTARYRAQMPPNSPPNSPLPLLVAGPFNPPLVKAKRGRRKAPAKPS